MEFKDYYRILGVDPKASQDEIQRAYRKLARKYHPDVSDNPDAEARFKEVSEAYEALKDPEKRAAYDQAREQPQGRAGSWQPPPGWEGGFDFGGGGFTSVDPSEFSEFFETLFGGAPGGAQRRGGPGFSARGADQRARIRVDLETAYHGGSRAITLQEPERAPDGAARTRERTLNVRIPPGVTDGQQIRLRGQGEPGRGGAAAGDIYLEVEIEPHARFQLEGRDIYVTVPIAPWEAALGARIQVPTLDGNVDMKVPPGSQSGKKLRLRGRGMPGKPKGDQYVILRIVTPPADNDKAKAAYRRMAEEMPFNPRAGD